MKKARFLRRLSAIFLSFCARISALTASPLTAVADEGNAYESPAPNTQTHICNFDESIILFIFRPPAPD